MHLYWGNFHSGILKAAQGEIGETIIFLNPSMFWKFHSHFFSAYKELSTTTNILHSWFHWCWKVGFSSTILQKKLRFQMVQGHRAATGGESIHVHLTLTPKVVPSPHAALGTSCMLHAYSQSALLQQVPAGSKALARKGAFWGSRARSMESCWLGRKSWPGGLGWRSPWKW